MSTDVRAELAVALGDRYAVERRLGAGGMAEVFAARDNRHDRMVAVKVVRHNAASLNVEKRFEREVRIAAQLQHPQIVPLYDSGTGPGLRYFVMPLIEGPSLRRCLEERGQLPVEEVMRIATQLADALDYAHAQGIIHRDIKPENILLSGGHALVADFGIALPAPERLASSTLTEEGFALGTAAYMSPEQAAGERTLDGRTDQYALGCVIYELLTGRPPFVAESAQAVIAQHFIQPAPPLHLPAQQAPPALDEVLGRALAKEPTARFGTTGEFAAALREASRRSNDSGPSAAPFGTRSAGNLPSAATPLIGRSQILKQAVALLRRPEVRLVTFTGTGGTGKTRLALEAGARVRSEFEGGVWFVSLAAVSDTRLVPATVMQALHVHGVSGTSAVEALAAHLGRNRTLLILDDFERHVPAAAWVGELLSHTENLTVLVTSRVLLRLRLEQEFEVPPLALPDLSAPIDESTVAATASVQLFVERARTVDPSFVISEENAAHIAEICARLDGLPLAIELAAARVKLLPPRAIVGRLQNRLRLLTGGARDLPERHQTLRQAVAWSYDLLGDAERRLFVNMAVFVGGCTIESAEAICNPDGALPIEVLDGIATLADASLLVRDTRPGRGAEPRIRMLETVREFAAGELDADPNAEAVRDLHRDWFLDLARRAAPGLAGAQQEVWLATVAAEHANIGAALDRCIRLNDAERALAFGAALWRYWLVRGHLAEGREWLDRALALPAEERLAPLRAEVLAGAAKLAHNLSDLDGAAALGAAALELRRRLGDTAGVAHGLADLGWIAWLRCDYADARAFSSESLRIAESLGDRRAVAQALSNLGWVLLFEGDLTGARDAFERGLGLRRELGDRRNIAFMLTALGWTASRAGEPARALALLEETLPTFRAVGDDLLYAFALSLIAEASLRTGDIRRAQSVLESESLPALRRCGDRWGIALALDLLSRVAREQGDPERAELLARESMDLCRAIRNRYGLAQALASLGQLATQRGDLAKGRALYVESLGIRREIGDRTGIDECEQALAPLGGG